MSQEKQTGQSSKTPSEEVATINQAIADYIKCGLVSEDIAKQLLSKCNSHHLHLGQTLVKEGHLKMSQLVKIMQTIGAKSKPGTSTGANVAPRQEKSGLVGNVFGKYEIVKELGRGGMGVVYQARQQDSGLLVALKILLAGPGADAVQVQRFLRESKTTSSLEHPNIIRIYDIGEEGGYHYFTMQFVDGSTFEHLLQNPQVALAEKLGVFRKICRALQHAHNNKIIHRDLKPSNVLLDKSGEPFLSDFGLAKSIDSDSHLTQTGSALGTPFYMSPEQVKGDRRKIDTRSDIYSLGIILYQIMTGKVPFIAEVLPELYRKIANEEAVFDVPDLPRALQAVCRKAIEKNPELRYQNAGELADDVDNFLAGKKTRAQKFEAKRAWSQALRQYRRQLIVGMWVGGVLMLLGLGGLRYHQERQKEAAARAAHLAQVEASEQELQSRYNDGMVQLKDKPEEACLYFEYGLQIIAREKAKGDKSFLAKEKIDAMEPRLYLASMEAYARAGHYRQCYELGTRLLRSDIGDRNLIMWQTACSAYQDELYIEAEEYLQKLLQTYRERSQRQELTDAEQERLLGSLYYLGMICFHRQQWAQAQQLFKQALAARSPASPTYVFWPLLQLHYCACMVVDIEQKIGEQTAKEVAANLSPAQEERAPDIYREVQARYRLMLAQTKQGDEALQLAQQAVDIVNQCFASGVEKADLYYIRGRAQRIIGNYPQAKLDFTTASEFEDVTGQFNYLSAQLDLFGDYLQPNEFQNHYVEFLRDVDKNIRVRPNLFAPEFAKLRRHCRARQLSMAKRTPFSEERLDELCQLLDSPSQIRQVAEVALSAMSPTAQVVKSLQLKIQHADNDARRQALGEICRQVEETERKRRMYQVLVDASEIYPYGKVWSLRKFCSAEAVEFLQTVFADRQQPLTLRFLAGRILVNMPDLQVRKAIWRDYAQNADDLVAMVLAIRLLQETGFITVFAEKRLGTLLADVRYEDVGWSGDGLPTLFTVDEEKEFFQSLLAEVLPSHEEKVSALWKWLLTQCSRRVQGIAATRFARAPGKDILPFLVASIQSGIDNPNLDLQMWNITVLSTFLNSPEEAVRKEWQQMFEQYFSDDKLYLKMCELTASAIPQLQKTVLNFWRGSSALLFREKYAIRKQKVLELLRPFWKHRDSIVRCHSVMSSAELFDMQVFDTAFARQEFTILEKWAVCIGALRCQEHSRIAKGNKQLTKLMMGALNNPKESPHLRGGILYLLSRFSHTNLETSMEKALIEHVLLDSLKSQSLVQRLWAIISISNFANVSDKMMNVLLKMKSEHPSHNIRAATHGVLLDMALRKGQSANLDALHQEVKQKTGKQREDYYWAALWGYTFAVENTMNPAYEEGNLIGWDPDAVWEFKRKDFYRKIEPLATLRQEFIVRLEKTLDLLADFHDERLFSHYTYLLAVVYAMEKNYTKALQLLESGMASLGERDAQLTDLWVELMLAQKRYGEVAESVQKKLANLGATEWNLVKMENRARYEAQLRRGYLLSCLARWNEMTLEEQQRLRPLMENLAYDQALLCPLQPVAWIMLAHYHLCLSQPENTVVLCRKVLPRMPQNSSPLMWLARGHASLGEWEMAFKDLQAAAHEKTIPFPVPIADYPEFRRLPASLKAQFLPYVK